jgi:hypothetical protein
MRQPLTRDGRTGILREPGAIANYPSASRAYTSSGSSISRGAATSGVPSLASGYSKILPS